MKFALFGIFSIVLGFLSYLKLKKLGEVSSSLSPFFPKEEDFSVHLTVKPDEELASGGFHHVKITVRNRKITNWEAIEDTPSEVTKAHPAHSVYASHAQVTRRGSLVHEYRLSEHEINAHRRRDIAALKTSGIAHTFSEADFASLKESDASAVRERDLAMFVEEWSDGRTCGAFPYAIPRSVDEWAKHVHAMDAESRWSGNGSLKTNNDMGKEGLYFQCANKRDVRHKASLDAILYTVCTSSISGEITEIVGHNFRASVSFVVSSKAAPFSSSAAEELGASASSTAHGSKCRAKYAALAAASRASLAQALSSDEEVIAKAAPAGLPKPFFEHRHELSHPIAFAKAHDFHAKRSALYGDDPQYNCVFLHGAGQDTFAPPTPKFSEYWGKMNKYTPQCKSRTYVRANTHDSTWDEEKLMLWYCSAALAYSDSGSKVITNTLIFAHSMGNLIISAAMKFGHCTLGENSKFFAVSGPVVGSTVADSLKSLCSEETEYPNLAWIFTQFQYCLPDKTVPPSYESIATVYPPGFMTSKAGFVHRSGNMCGSSPLGLISVYSAAFSLISNLANTLPPEDGMVQLESCSPVAHGNGFADSPDADFYLGDLNHADTCCLTGDGFFGSSRLPCSYYTFRS